MQYEARPTQYKGITFKSKSEAIVARGFDLAGVLWEYEPTLWDCDGNHLFKDKYKPDFKLAFKELNHVCVCFIEYKPKKPNAVYIKELDKRFMKIQKHNAECSIVLLVGNPFDKDINDYGLYFTFNDKLHNVEVEEGSDWRWMYSHWEEAKKYRFDLCE